jgi:putative transposase
VQATQTREQKGRGISEKGTEVKRIDEHAYEVISQSGNGTYSILSTEYGWSCSCPDSQYRGVDCKHILAVKFSAAIRKVVKVTTIHQVTSSCACIYCGSDSIAKDGIRHNKAGDIQVFNCKACGRYFTINLGFERMHASPQAITSAMQLYFTGESLRNVQKFLRLQGVNVSHVCVLKWIRKYVKLMDGYLDKLNPQLGDTWRTDEMYVKFSGNMKYLFAMMDDETRFRISQQVADHKGTSDVRPMFRESIEIAGKKPKVLISDGANNFHEAWRKEMWDEYGRVQSPQHIREISMGGSVHNNKMERQNGEVRDREKTMRGMKNPDSLVLKGYQIFHNFIREHEGLNGKTPAEAAGIKIEGDNRWLTIIQNASKTAETSSS